MKAPDKIYIQTDGKTITHNKVFNTDIAYIRKKTLLEWATKMRDLCPNNPEELLFSPSYCAYQNVVDKLNEM